MKFIQKFKFFIRQNVLPFGCNIYRVLLCVFFIILGSCVSAPPTSKTRSPYRKTSKPYCIKGKWYYPQQHYELSQRGMASFYGDRDKCHGKKTATGEIFNMFALTAAHKTLPLPCVVWIRNLKNGRELKLRVNDRGPFKKGRILDVSARAAHILGFYQDGTAPIYLVTLIEESLQLPENRKLKKLFISSKKKDVVKCLPIQKNMSIERRIESAFEKK